MLLQLRFGYLPEGTVCRLGTIGIKPASSAFHALPLTDNASQLCLFWPKSLYDSDGEALSLVILKMCLRESVSLSVCLYLSLCV